MTSPIYMIIRVPSGCISILHYVYDHNDHFNTIPMISNNYNIPMIIVDWIGGRSQTQLSYSESLPYRVRIGIEGENFFCGQAYYTCRKYNSELHKWERGKGYIILFNIN